jgi:hypothetical protein
MAAFVFPDSKLRQEGDWKFVPIGKGKAKEILSHGFASIVQDPEISDLIEDYLEITLPSPKNSIFMKKGDKAIVVGTSKATLQLQCFLLTKEN